VAGEKEKEIAPLEPPSRKIVCPVSKLNPLMEKLMFTRALKSAPLVGSVKGVMKIEAWVKKEFELLAAHRQKGAVEV
jgi:hypothetical protein